MMPAERLRALADTQPDRDVTKRQRGFAARMLEQLFADHAETRRRCLLLAAFGADSMAELQPRQVHAILAWLSPTRDDRGRMVPTLSAEDRGALAGGCGQ